MNNEKLVMRIWNHVCQYDTKRGVEYTNAMFIGKVIRAFQV